jgi:hypothetical protein
MSLCAFAVTLELNRRELCVGAEELSALANSGYVEDKPPLAYIGERKAQLIPDERAQLPELGGVKHGVNASDHIVC